MVKIVTIILFLLILIVIIWGASTDWKFISFSSKKSTKIKEFLKPKKDSDNQKAENNKPKKDSDNQKVEKRISGEK